MNVYKALRSPLKLGSATNRSIDLHTELVTYNTRQSLDRSVHMAYRNQHMLRSWPVMALEQFHINDGLGFELEENQVERIEPQIFRLLARSIINI